MGLAERPALPFTANAPTAQGPTTTTTEAGPIRLPAIQQNPTAVTAAAAVPRSSPLLDVAAAAVADTDATAFVVVVFAVMMI